MRKTHVFITGANGFVGSKIIEKLITLNQYQISGLVRKTSDLTFLEAFKKKIKLFYGDITQKETLIEAFKNQDIVIHAAAFPSDWGDDDKFYSINVKGTKNICELCLQYGIKHLVHISSISIYGFGNRKNCIESSPVIKNKFPYCITKLEAEESVRHFIDVFNLPATIIQPGQIYGPNDRTMSYKIIEAINKHRFGMCNSGRHLLSPLYIDNLIQAILLIIHKPKKSMKKTYIVTDDVEISWKEFTKNFCDILNKPMPWLNLPRIPAFIMAYILEFIYKLFGIKSAPMLTLYRISIISDEFHFSSRRIRKELGYKPDQNLRKNIEKTIQHYNKLKKEEKKPIL